MESMIKFFCCAFGQTNRIQEELADKGPTVLNSFHDFLAFVR